jgi:DNA-binding MarR family transcriptional regulator
MLVLWVNLESNNKAEHKTASSLTVNRLGERLMLDSGTLTPLLKRLEERKLIKRTRSNIDERQVHISLRDEGIELSKEAAHVPMRLLCEVGAPIQDLIALKDQLEGLISHIKD